METKENRRLYADRTDPIVFVSLTVCTCRLYPDSGLHSFVLLETHHVSGVLSGQRTSVIRVSGDPHYRRVKGNGSRGIKLYELTFPLTTQVLHPTSCRSPSPPFSPVLRPFPFCSAEQEGKGRSFVLLTVLSTYKPSSSIRRGNPRLGVCHCGKV